ncbi:hypothetical protein BCR44DRAFT_352195 [Catenaria anguillulae PL171]|uniref:Uncharacterized protein n=1 Tax=Catenaria anguillulae PL171 TaxID=765915 RepID=A0A1Y2HQM4_9FUNG|nr:hypothetical protein BCR44DRAFT_352195 [Catenaria anguillulae PL171]
MLAEKLRFKLTRDTPLPALHLVQLPSVTLFYTYLSVLFAVVNTASISFRRRVHEPPFWLISAPPPETPSHRHRRSQPARPHPMSKTLLAYKLTAAHNSLRFSFSGTSISSPPDPVRPLGSDLQGAHLP